MSCGAAVVTTDLRTFKGLVIHRKNGIKVPVKSPQALAEGITECYDNRNQYGMKARQTIVEYYSSHQIFPCLAEIIKSCPN